MTVAKKISAYTGLSAISDLDELVIVDVSDLTSGSDGTTKKITKASLFGDIQLSDLDDVGTSTTTDGNVLMADGTDWDSKTPDAGGLVTKTGSQTLTNKTLTSPAITSPVLTTPQLNDTSADHQYVTAVSELAVDRTVTMPLLTGNDEFVFKAHAATLTNKTLTTPIIAQISNTGTLTLPTSTDTLVGKATTDVLTNKTMVQKVTSYTPAGAATATLNVTTGGIHAITMPAGNITIAISNEAVGQCFMIEITQDGTGSRTVTWFSTITWANGSAPTLTTTGAKTDTFGFRVTSADNYYGYIVGQNI